MNHNDSNQYSEEIRLNALNLELLTENIEYFCKYRGAAEWVSTGTSLFAYPMYPDGIALYPLLQCIGDFDYEYDQHVKEIKKSGLQPTDLNLEQIRSYLTFIVRGERFCDGHIEEYMKNLVILKLCLRLEDLARGTMSKEHVRSYSLLYIQSLQQEKDRDIEHNEEEGIWILHVKLDAEGLWQLQVCFKEDGTFEKYSIECPSEGLRCEFKDEKEIRLTKPFVNTLGHEYMLMDQVLRRYIQSQGVEELRKFVKMQQEIHTEKTILSRYKGCLIGGAVGDALGYPVEFWNEAQIHNAYGSAGIQRLEQAGIPAKISDDTQMTLFAANAIIYARTQQKLLGENLKRAYWEWLSTQDDDYEIGESYKMWIYKDSRLHHLRAPGNTCLSALHDLVRSKTIQYAENNSKGCGTVMRAAPYGLIEHYNPETAKGDAGIMVMKAAILDAKLTHGHPAAYGASVALAKMIFNILQYSNKPDMTLNEIVAGVQSGVQEVDAILQKALKLAEDIQVSDIDGIHALGQGWIAEEALAIAVFCALRYQNDFAGAIRTAVNHKGDSDSTGAICGNLLGAWLGYEEVRKAYNVEQLELYDVICEIAEDLYRATEEKIPQAGEDVKWDQKYRR